MAVRLLGAQTTIGNALKTAAQKLNLAVEEVDVQQAAKGLFVAAPLQIDQQLKLVSGLKLHTKVVTASNRVKGSAYYGVSVSSVTPLTNYCPAGSSKLNLFEVYSKSGFAEAAKRHQDLRKEIAALFNDSALAALLIAANSSNSSLGIVTKSQGKFNPQLDAILWEVAESLSKSDKRFEKVGVTNIRYGQAFNKLVTNPEKLSVLLATPEEDSQKLADLVVGLGGGRALVPVDYQGKEGTVFTASNNQSNNPLASFLALSRYLQASGKAAEANKINAAVDSQITALALKEKNLANAIKGEEITKGLVAAIQ